MTKDEQKEEKRRVLIGELERAPRGTKTRLAKHVPVTTRTVSLWLNGERWPQTPEDEARMWDFVGYALQSDGNIVKKKEGSLQKESPHPLTPEEEEIALDYAIACLAKLRKEQWETLRQAVKMIQGGKKDGTA